MSVWRDSVISELGGQCYFHLADINTDINIWALNTGEFLRDGCRVMRESLESVMARGIKRLTFLNHERSACWQPLTAALINNLALVISDSIIRNGGWLLSSFGLDYCIGHPRPSSVCKPLPLGVSSPLCYLSLCALYISLWPLHMDVLFW